MSNIKFKSIKDIFEGSMPERFLSTQEKRDLENKRKKEDGMKIKYGSTKEVYKNIDYIEGY